VNWLDRLERRFGHIAVRGLATYIVALNAAVYILKYIDPSGNFLSKLDLQPAMIMKGEVWRLITYIFIPPETSPIWIVFVLYLYYLVGMGLEQEWGSFRLNVYYLIGMLATTIAAFITGFSATAVYLNLSMFLAFAAVYPDYRILLFFILPIKVKYIAWLNWVYIVFTVIVMPIPFKAAAAASVVNYIIFFGRDIIKCSRARSSAYYNKRRFMSEIQIKSTMHRCSICGKTERDDPRMDFRYCADCEGDYEYCMDHLYTHEHIKK